MKNFPTPTGRLPVNTILELDSYKLSHPDFYPRGVTGMHSNIVARSKGDTIVVMGLTQWIKSRFLAYPATMDMVNEAEAFCAAHGEPFNREAWVRVVEEFGGYIPITLRGVPEGLKVPSGNVVVSIECSIPGIFWMPSNRETSLLRGVWYPSTIASNDLQNYRALKRFASDTCTAPEAVLPFQLHDFGGRGVTSAEQAEIGGAAHLVFFQGSDTVEGVRAANFYYNSPMSAFSVLATEHTIQCSYGPAAQTEYLNSIIDECARKSKAAGRPMIVSIVIDGYDTVREVLQLCSPEFVAKVRSYARELGMKVVIRPDSGDPLELVPQILRIMENGYGATVNAKGYKEIGNIEGHPFGSCIGLIWGDGINKDSMVEILEKVTDNGYASSSIVFGSGGGLLQSVTRDTFKWAQKATAIKTGGRWVPIYKDPKTDPGKKSFAGRKTLVRSKLTGEFMTADLDNAPLDPEWEDMFITYLDETRPGELLVNPTLDEIRARAKA